MDDLIVLFLKVCFAPFWLAWHAVRLSWQHLVKPIFAHFERKGADQYQAQQLEAQSEKEKIRDEARAKQLAALNAAVPPGIPEKMRATIQLHEIKVARVEQQRKRHAFGEDAWPYVEVGEDTKHTVDMILQLSETERAIIGEHQLQHLVIEDAPLFNEDQLRKIRLQDQAEIAAIKDPVAKIISEQSREMGHDQLKKDRKQTFLGDYLVSPFTRMFDTPPEAKSYADKLKTKILPQIKQHIDAYRDHKQSETIEF